MSNKGSNSSNRSRWHRWGGYLAAVALLAVGAGSVLYFLLTKPAPVGEPLSDPGRLVRAFRVHKGSHRVAATAFGTARAATEWNAIAEVGGRAIEVHDDFRAGAFLLTGTLLVRIDPTDYELVKRRHEAELKSTQEQIRELDQTEKNTQQLLELAERKLALDRKEWERLRGLYDRDLEASKAVDDGEKALVAQDAVVQELRNVLALTPIQRDRLQASLELVQAKLDEAVADLGKTEIRLPFDARCRSRNVEAGEYVAPGTDLGVFLSLDKAEVVAELEVRQLRTIIQGAIDHRRLLDPVEAVAAMKEFSLPADITWATGEMPGQWQGHVVRLESSLDPQTRAAHLIVEVPEPYLGTIPGVQPPLLPGIFCKVKIYGSSLDDVYVLPRDCLHDERVYLIRDGQLHIATVEVSAVEEELAVASGGLEDGDLVVLSELTPAVAGMKLRAEEVPCPVTARPAGTRDGETGTERVRKPDLNSPSAPEQTP